MYSSLQIARKYLHYYRTAFNGRGHGMHSPFVFRFIVEVLRNHNGYTPPAAIDALRRQLLRDQKLLQVTDLGAGSRRGGAPIRSVGQVAASAVKARKYAHLLYRLVCRYQPRHIVELGTSLGITTACLAAANPQAGVITIEGSAAIRQVALENFATLGLKNIRSLEGNFDTLLPAVLADLPALDLAFVDGNHRQEPTLRYFHQLVEKAHNDTILVFDDIHWSADMEAAWAAIQQHPSVRCTVDVFFMGFVFFRSAFREKQHFTIRF